MSPSEITTAVLAFYEWPAMDDGWRPSWAVCGPSTSSTETLRLYWLQGLGDRQAAS